MFNELIPPDQKNATNSPSFNISSEEEEVDEIFYIYYWPGNKDVWEIYRILINYLTDNYRLDTGLALAMVNKRGLDIEEFFIKLHHIHDAFLVEYLNLE